jgi:uncharacterized repeat protein (TIGR01451 family)
MGASSTAVTVGGQVTFTMVVTNNGPGPATGVQVNDTLPAALGLVSIGASQGSCGGTSCSLGGIADGGSATVTLVARAQAPGVVANTASVSSSTVDPVPANGTASVSVTISAPQSPPPALPPPESGEVNVTPGTGSGQCVALKGEPGCQPLTGGEQIDIRDIAYINPGTGKVEIQSVVGIGSFYGGTFSLQEIGGAARSAAAGAAKPILVVRLVGGSFKRCSKANRTAAGASVEAKKTAIRRLWGKGKGRFRTRGRFSSGTVRGTNWLTTDYCDGTETRVVTGVVQVYDFVKKRWVVLKPGQKYFAKAG